ncbi:MAG: DUF1573 domain-containing protein [Alloprevotella sp.]|nr:DUF1573 domain-containing protein [Alloprevotella sp.]
MKKILLLAAMAFTAFAQDAMAQAVIKFDKTTINVGSFTEDKPQTCTFEFTNTGDKPLVIQQAFSSCGCTVPKYTEEPIAPGQKGKITVTYNGKGKAPGSFKKPITVRSNAKNSMARIFIEGTMAGTKKQ